MLLRPRRAAVASLATALALTSLTPPVARAQLAEPALAPTAPQSAPRPDATPPPGPTPAGARAGVATTPMHAARAQENGGEERAPRNGPGFGQPEALMIVGGAGVVIGLLIGGGGGGALAFGGAVVGLVGLDQYIR
ncbi:MAG: hypothetical protein ACXWZ4_10810 [Gemmatirosa sp.]